MWPFRGRPRPRTPQDLGSLGERLALRHLRSLGYKVLARNFRSPDGEADVIALDTSTRTRSGVETIVFVEVKSRASDAAVDPESAVDGRKRRVLAEVARYYLARRDTAGYAVRFDVIAVVVPPRGRPSVRHTVGAFEAT